MEIDKINNTTIDSNIDKIVEQLRCAIPLKSAYYVSIPITSGKKFIEWYKKDGITLKKCGDDIYRNAHFTVVISDNIKNASLKIDKIRNKTNRVIIDPTQLQFGEWEQDEYRYYWGKVIEKYVYKTIFFNGWEYSNGCSYEFLKSYKCGIECLDENFVPIKIKNAVLSLSDAIYELSNYGLETNYLERIQNELNSEIHSEVGPNQLESPINLKNSNITTNQIESFKDDVLNNLAFSGNVAQFVSFRPVENKKIEQKYCRIAGFSPNHKFTSPNRALEKLLEKSPEGQVNIRTYMPNNPKGFPFFYGLSSVNETLDKLYELTNAGLHTIVNETIDVEDGGVSGVMMNDVIEFSPGDTPKCVDKPGVCQLHRRLGINLLNKVYGFRPKILFPPNFRVEFSIHPSRRGYLQEHTIIWEIEAVENITSEFEITWPNNFSRFIGDKAFGLLVADVLNVPVPRTIVIPRKISPFCFGVKTGTFETWIRTCPEIPVPGYYPTEFGWKDPFELIAINSKGISDSGIDTPMMSILSQESVDPIWSGALIPQEGDLPPIIEGVMGKGDKFMLGKNRDDVPENVLNAVLQLFYIIEKQLGPVSLEWVFDGSKAWCVQMHRNMRAYSSENVIYPSKNKKIEYVNFFVEDGLNALRQLIRKINNKNVGIALVGDVGLSSHFGDILRSAKIPSKLKRNVKKSV